MTKTKTDLLPRGSKLHATTLLHKLGQSLWLDNITRDLLDQGTLKRYIDELSVTGLTSNPTIFEQAIKNSTAYDADIRDKLKEGKSEEQIFFELALADLIRAADLFRPIYDQTNGVDGWVSLEVSPLLAHDTAATVAAAKDLFARAGRPNVFIKIPGTKEGLPAIEEAIFAGVPVNVTLLFSREQYLAAAEAFLRGIERRIDAGVKAERRVSGVSIHQSMGRCRQGQSACPTTKQTWDRYRVTHVQSSARISKLRRAGIRLYSAGAWPQRLLWASTGVKDPRASPVLYVKALAAPFTIDTMPEGTLKALAEETELGSIMAADGGDCEQVLAEFTAAGIDIDALAERLQDEGTKSFAKSWESLMAVIASKRESGTKAA